jgi:Tol biopolymer transport system component
MKTTLTIIALLLNALLLKAQVNKENIQLGVSKISAKPKGGAQYVFESPNANYICYSGNKLNNVYLKSNTQKNSKLLFTGNNCGYMPSWNSTSNAIYMRNKYKQEGKYLIQTMVHDINTNITKQITNILPQSINGAVVDPSLMVYINNKLQLVKYISEIKETVIIEKDKQCYQPILSPNKKLIAVHIGSEIWIYDAIGNNPAYSLGQGLANAWSPDSKYLLGHIDESKDGHEMSGSELFIYNVTSKTNTKITNTPTITELNPSWGYNGKYIYYINEKNGFIYTAPINF